jgi:hypothetical protein
MKRIQINASLNLLILALTPLKLIDFYPALEVFYISKFWGVSRSLNCWKEEHSWLIRLKMPRRFHIHYLRVKRVVTALCRLNDDRSRVFSGDIGGTFNALQQQLQNLKLSLSQLPSVAKPSSSSASAAVRQPPTPSAVAALPARVGVGGDGTSSINKAVLSNDDQEEEEEEGVEVVHFGVV